MRPIMGLIVRPFLISTKHMSADIFTKAVDEETFFFCKHTLRPAPQRAKALD